MALPQWDVGDNDTDRTRKGTDTLPYTLLMTSASPASPEGLPLKSWTGDGDGDSNRSTVEQ
jgi:hypothetical protein